MTGLKTIPTRTHLVLVLALTFLTVSLGLTPRNTSASPPPQATAPADEWPIAGGRFFTQARGDAPAGHGYAVVDDADAPFWSEFQRLRGVAGVGYPVSGRFVWNGFTVQAFQKAVFQWRPGAGRVAFVNVLDELSRQGRDDWLTVARSVPSPASFDEVNRPPEQVMAVRLSLLDADPDIREAFFSREDWLDLHGLPVAPIADYGPVRVLRAQRVVIQQWLIDTPWAAAGQVVFANGGDLVKEARLIPPEAATPAIGPPPVASGTVPPLDEAGRRLTVPTGFAVRIFDDLGAGARPRLMAVGPDGSLYVALFAAGRIVRLPDRDSDGRSDGAEEVAAGLSLPHSLAWLGDWLYVAEGDRIEALRDADGDGWLETRSLITNNIPGPRGHSTRTARFGPDGKLYVSTGSSCNACLEDDPRRAAILRFNPDGSIPADNPLAGDPDPRRQPLWAWGLRNSVDFLWTPDGQLWATHNGSDNLGDDLPPEEVIIALQPGQHHGWPDCYTPDLGAHPPGSHREVAVPNPTGGTDCAAAVPALFTDLAHAAPLGIASGWGSGFPVDYQSDVFVAYHGSWNTTPESIRDCPVRRIRVEAGLPVAAEDFVTGWRAPGRTCGDPAAWGRPAGVTVGPDGALYISDDAGGRIFRVVVAVGP
ncbi:MAG TPA: PQQ-dependent sugar dehydrogenase [Dehalococcoidia bacterium]|nr:PQQ-dependent sugar dehydrogenase [Dehalococcoidia bacterium]